MPGQKIATIFFPSNKDGHLTTRIRNLGEDLWREIESRGLGDVGGLKTVDKAIDTLVVRAENAQLVGQVKKRIENLLKAHLLHKLAAVTYK
ncbi:hypothetical protein AAFN47_06125 [Hoeflea sp. CAU 1731]